MYQSFDDDFDPQAGAPRLKHLRAHMQEAGLDVFLVPREDAYMGEYVPASGERLKWLTGFGGSAGIAAVMADRAALLVDGRYVLQAPQQVDTACFEIVPIMETRLVDWLNAHVSAGQTIGFDPMLHTRNQINLLKKQLTVKDVSIIPVTENPLDKAWHDRPAPPCAPVVAQSDALAGRTSPDKRQSIGQQIAERKADAFLLTQPESIAWILNIRGADVPHTPFVLSYGLAHKDGRFDWFIDPERVPRTVREHMGTGVELIPPHNMATHLQSLSDNTVLLDPGTANFGFAEMLGDFIDSPDLCALPKACKTEAEINGARKAHIRDGAALCAFLHWLDQQAPKGGVSEISAAQRLEAFRRDTGHLKDLSFDTISGSGPNGAIVHYRVTETTNRILQPGELYLVDSGGQYSDGTTDVTRTILIDGAAPPVDAVMAFTRVLKGHIALACARFPKGTDGVMLDALARAPLWAAGLDFDHGTGHGVGAYLSVHEGPQRISKGGTVALQSGMIVSNEPGYYRADAFGIRIENLQFVTPATPPENGERPMHGFETLTLAPIDTRLIDPTLLTDDERDWLDTYHARVHETISPLLDSDAAAWLAAATSPLQHQKH